jgi:hypothetical protein
LKELGRVSSIRKGWQMSNLNDTHKIGPSPIPKPSKPLYRNAEKVGHFAVKMSGIMKWEWAGYVYEFSTALCLFEYLFNLNDTHRVAYCPPEITIKIATIAPQDEPGTPAR